MRNKLAKCHENKNGSYGWSRLSPGKDGGHNSTGLGSKMIAGSGKQQGSAVKFLQFINFTTSILKFRLFE